MSLTVTPVSSSTNCVDVRWSSSASYMLPTTSCFYLVYVQPNDNANAGHQWTVVVRDSKASALRLDLELSGIAGTALITVKRCCVTRSALGVEHWKVELVGKSSSAASAAASSDHDPLESLSRPSATLTTPLGDDYRLYLYWLFICLHSQCLLTGGALKLAFCCSLSLSGACQEDVAASTSVRHAGLSQARRLVLLLLVFKRIYYNTEIKKIFLMCCCV